MGFVRRTLFSRVVLVLLACGVVVAGTGAGTIWYFARSLPSLEALRDYRPIQATRVYADDGSLIGQFFVERRIVVPLAQMPRHLFQALLAIEDARFYEHRGIDPLSIVRALFVNIESLRIRQGASTITQQLARTLFLTREKTLARKIREALVARRMEEMLTKDEILELYLNQIYFGHGAYGVQAAAQLYFGKDMWDLTLAESALLAGLPQAPSRYSPYAHPDKARHRQSLVLKRMLELGYITGMEYRQALKEEFSILSPRRDQAVAPHFLEYIRLHLIATYGHEVVYREGLKVYTTLSTVMQQAATRAVRRGLLALDKRQGYRGPRAQRTPDEVAALPAPASALAELEPGTVLEGIVTRLTRDGAEVWTLEAAGRIPKADLLWARRLRRGPDVKHDVLFRQDAGPDVILHVGDVVLVGVTHRGVSGTLFTLEQEPEVEGALIAIDPHTGAIKAMVGGYDFKQSEFNRAVSSRRQPGSAFKPFVYGAALEAQYTLASLVVDAPVIYPNTATGEAWKPENYEETFYGPTTLRDALAHSRNLATVRLAEQIRIPRVIAFARQTGIASPLTQDLTLALGSSGVSLLELTSAYGVFAAQGLRAEPYAILAVERHDDLGLERQEPQPREVLSPETAYLMTSMLESVVQDGTGWRAKVLGRPLAGKTGTTNEYTDAWFIGFAPTLAAGVWVGFDDIRTLGEREAGSAAALPIWVEFMQGALAGIPPDPFPVPQGVVFVQVDPKTGLLASADTQGAVMEVFIKGSEPTTYTVARPQATKLFQLDLDGA